MNESYNVSQFQRRPRAEEVIEDVITISSDEEPDYARAITNSYNGTSVKVESNTENGNENDQTTVFPFNDLPNTPLFENDLITETRDESTDLKSNHTIITTDEEFFDTSTRVNALGVNALEQSESNQSTNFETVLVEERSPSTPAIVIKQEKEGNILPSGGIHWIVTNYADSDDENIPADNASNKIQDDDMEIDTTCGLSTLVVANAEHPQHDAVADSSVTKNIAYSTETNQSLDHVDSVFELFDEISPQDTNREFDLYRMQQHNFSPMIPQRPAVVTHSAHNDAFHQNFLDNVNHDTTDINDLNVTSNVNSSQENTSETENERIVLMATKMFEDWKKNYEEEMQLKYKTRRSERVARKRSQSWYGESSTSGIDKKRTKVEHNKKSSTYVSGGQYSSAASKNPKLLSERPIIDTPKNTDQNLYLNNPRALKCVLCTRTYKRSMVYHYKTAHKENEVFVSRLSPEMAEIARSEQISVERHIKTWMKYLKTMCFFCETIKNFTSHYWITHIRSHTGEYSKVCTECNKTVCYGTHCGHATVEKITFDLKESDLKAFICRECNFIQIDEERIRTHLIKEHEVENTNDRYDEILLLPAWNDKNQQTGDTRAQNANVIAGGAMLRDVHLENDVTVVNESGGCLLPMANPIKMDANEEHNLLNTANHYRQVSLCDYHVRPWLDDDYASKNIRSPIAQFALYKCMHDRCIFSTNSEEQWSSHMVEHLKLIDTLQMNNMLTNGIRSEQNKYRECPYCVIDRHKDYQVTAHIETEHRRSIFQCSFCYYRTIEIENIFLHFNEFHANEEKEILLCGEQREFEHDNGTDILWEGEQYIEQFKCDGCTQQFTYFDSFHKHLKKSHASVYTCAYCKLTMECNENIVQDHLKYHNYAEFQCINCKAGFKEISEMRAHMAKNHPSKFLFVATRRSKHRLIYIGDSCLDACQFKLFKCSDSELLNCMDPKLSSYDQHKHQLEILDENKLKVLYTGPIPPITFTNTTDDFFTKYEDYVKSIAYRCITADEIKRISQASTEIQRLNEQHVCFVAKSNKEILEHRLNKHVKEPMVYLQIENTTEMMAHIIVRCTFQCNMCQNEFETKSLLKDHYSREHFDSIFNASIKQHALVVGSSNPGKPFGSSTIQTNQFSFFTMFFCSFDKQLLGTMQEALQHHDKEHRDQYFDFNMKSLLFENKQYPGNLNELIGKNLRMYLFECHHCSSCFDAIDILQAHSKDAHPAIEPNFIVKKLVACAYCKTVSTFKGIRQHTTSCHGNNIACCTTNPINAKQCGLCDQFIRSTTVDSHHQKSHQAGETLSDAVLKWLNVNKVDIDTCSFAPACCMETRFNQLLELVQHTFDCRRNFHCKECSDNFTTIKGIVAHHQIVHNKKANEIIVELQRANNSSKDLFSNMIIYFPNGLVATTKSIEDTRIGLKLQKILTQHVVYDIWPTEAKYIKSLCLK